MYSEQFDNATWPKARATITPNAITAPDGTLTADLLTGDGTGTAYVYRGVTLTQSAPYAASSFFKADSYTGAVSITDFTETGSVRVDLTTLAVSTTGIASGATVQSLGGGWYRLMGIFTPTIATGNHNIGVTQVASSTLGLYIWGAQLETGSTATTYQRIAAATDYDTVGFPHYLKFDGVDDSMATASTVDFTATDKMTVFAGVRKLSDATAYAMVAELSAISSSNNGAFGITAPGNSGNYGFSTRGTLSSDLFTTAGSYPAPVTSVMSARGAIATDTNKIRINGVEVKSGAADQGTGNYGNYPLYVGRRGGTTLPFNGHLYSLIIRGAASSDSQIISAESYVNSKTGAY